MSPIKKYSKKIEDRAKKIMDDVDFKVGDLVKVLDDIPGWNKHHPKILKGTILKVDGFTDDFGSGFKRVIVQGTRRINPRDLKKV